MRNFERKSKNFFLVQSAPRPQPLAPRRVGGLSSWAGDGEPEWDSHSDANDDDERRVEGGRQHGAQWR